MVTVSPDFRSRLAGLIKQQTAAPFDTLAYYQSIGRLYEKYPTAGDLLKQAIVIEQGGTTLPTL